MTLNNKCLLILFVSLFPGGVVWSQVGVGVDLMPSFSGSSGIDKEKKQLKDPFVFHFCSVLQQDYVTMRTLQRKGYGRIEMIKLVLMSREAGVPFDEIVKERNTLIPLKKIAKKYNIDYHCLRREAAEYKKKIEDLIRSVPVTEEEEISQKGKQSHEK